MRRESRPCAGKAGRAPGKPAVRRARASAAGRGRAPAAGSAGAARALGQGRSRAGPGQSRPPCPGRLAACRAARTYRSAQVPPCRVGGRRPATPAGVAGTGRAIGGAPGEGIGREPVQSIGRAQRQGNRAGWTQGSRPRAGLHRTHWSARRRRSVALGDRYPAVSPPAGVAGRTAMPAVVTGARRRLRPLSGTRRVTGRAPGEGIGRGPGEGNRPWAGPGHRPPSGRGHRPPAAPGQPRRPAAGQPRRPAAGHRAGRPQGNHAGRAPARTGRLRCRPSPCAGRRRGCRRRPRRGSPPRTGAGRRRSCGAGARWPAGRR